MSHPVNDTIIDCMRDANESYLKGLHEQLAVIKASLQSYIAMSNVLNVPSFMLVDILEKLEAVK